MTVLEYFDYEKRLMEDLKAVRTQRAKDAIYDSIIKVLDDHKKFVLDMMREFDAKVQESAKHLAQAYRGETPDYVKKLMAEFGLYELEEADDVSIFAKPVLDMKKPISAKRMKDLCADGDGLIEDFRKSRGNGLSDAEADVQNAKIMSANDPEGSNFGVDLTTMTADEFFKDSKSSFSDAANEALAKKSKSERQAKKGQKKATAKKRAVAKPDGKLG